VASTFGIKALFAVCLPPFHSLQKVTIPLAEPVALLDSTSLASASWAPHGGEKLAGDEGAGEREDPVLDEGSSSPEETKSAKSLSAKESLRSPGCVRSLCTLSAFDWGAKPNAKPRAKNPQRNRLARMTASEVVGDGLLDFGSHHGFRPRASSAPRSAHVTLRP